MREVFERCMNFGKRIANHDHLLIPKAEILKAEHVERPSKKVTHFAMAEKLSA